MVHPIPVDIDPDVVFEELRIAGKHLQIADPHVNAEWSIGHELRGVEGFCKEVSGSGRYPYIHFVLHAYAATFLIHPLDYRIPLAWLVGIKPQHMAYVSAANNAKSYHPNHKACPQLSDCMARLYVEYGYLNPAFTAKCALAHTIHTGAAIDAHYASGINYNAPPVNGLHRIICAAPDSLATLRDAIAACVAYRATTPSRTYNSINDTIEGHYEIPLMAVLGRVRAAMRPLLLHTRHRMQWGGLSANIVRLWARWLVVAELQPDVAASDAVTAYDEGCSFNPEFLM